MKKWRFYTQLSGSENHHGFILVKDGVRMGEIYPQDQDGIEGEKNAIEIVTLLNRKCLKTRKGAGNKMSVATRLEGKKK